MKLNIAAIKNILEGLGAPLLVVMFTWLAGWYLAGYLISRGTFHGIEDFVFSISLSIIIGFILGIFKRWYFFFGLLLFVSFSFTIRFIFTDYYLNSDSLIVQATTLFMPLTFSVPGFIVGWLTRVGGEKIYRYFKS